MNRTILVLAATLLGGCSSLPDTPIGNYPIGPHGPLEQRRTIICRYSDGTELIVRGVKDKEGCPKFEDKQLKEVLEA